MERQRRIVHRGPPHPIGVMAVAATPAALEFQVVGWPIKDSSAVSESLSADALTG